MPRPLRLLRFFTTTATAAVGLAALTLAGPWLGALDGVSGTARAQDRGGLPKPSADRGDQGAQSKASAPSAPIAPSASSARAGALPASSVANAPSASSTSVPSAKTKIGGAGAPVIEAKKEPKVPSARKAGPPPKADEMWVGATTDDLIAQLEKRALREGLAGGQAAIGSIMAIPSVADDATAGSARAALERIASGLLAASNASASASGNPSGNARGDTKGSAKGDERSNEARELSFEARTIARSIAPDAGTEQGRNEDAKIGLVAGWSLVGPFKDANGSGLDRAEGPEVAPSQPSATSFDKHSEGPVAANGVVNGAAKGAATGAAKVAATEAAKDKGAAVIPKRANTIELFSQANTRYDEGAYEVAWRAVPLPLVSARGIPLDALIFPRKETCSYLASAVTLPIDGTVVVRVSSSGSVRAMFDGVTFGRSEEQHALAVADRLAARVATTKGVHLLALKVCAGPNADSGRVRARVTTEAGDAVPGISFSDDLGKLPKSALPPVYTALLTPLARVQNRGSARRKL
ncbi:MAG: hypothetical protein NVSMB1_15090 [Polyangiales bacterium]